MEAKGFALMEDSKLFASQYRRQNAGQLKCILSITRRLAAMEDLVSLVPLYVRFTLVKEYSHGEITDLKDSSGKVCEYSSRVPNTALEMMVEPDFSLA